MSLIDQLKDIGKANIRQDEFLGFEKVIPTANTMQDELDDIRALGLGDFVEVDYYITPKKKNFLGNFVNVVLSVIQLQMVLKTFSLLGSIPFKALEWI